ncbi:MAG: ethylbenzene dehydrogenase-related protein, partial [bacterium]
MKTKMLVGFGLMMILLLGLVGCEGVSGPRGDAGNTGDPGQSWTAQSPDNRFFALAVCNGQMVNHSGAPKLYLAFDGEHQNAGDTIVSVRLAEGQVPNIDGVDEGSGGWGNQPTTVALEKVSGSDNLIASAAVRSAWDESYIYFQVKWTEVANEELGLVAAHSATPARWYVSQDLKTLANGYVRARGWTTVEPDDDYLLMMFETSGMQYFDHDGCFVTCHVGSGESNFHRTNQPRERMDTWIWSAALTQPTGYAADRYFDADTDPIVSLSWDLGTPVYTLNASFRDYD